MPIKGKLMRLAVMGAAMLAGAALGTPAAHAADVPPAPALKPLSMFSGAWNCSGAATGPDGSRTEFKTSVTVDFIYGGNFQRWQEVSSIAGTPVGTAEYTWGWDARHHRFTVDSIDSFGHHAVQTAPAWSGNSFVIKGTLSQPDGSSIPSRVTFTKTSASTFTVKDVVWLGAKRTKPAVSESSCTR
ncbi:DUF1579 family protein [Streptomyces sp. NPDC052396]|uniref:DUF1579 family protein n=1 Tax=Streptomyces sp. NPDC052396 TaxID=3365689 RepID=UPI0037CDBE96